MDPDIWCPPTFVGNSGIERFNGVYGFALTLCCVRHASDRSLKVTDLSKSDLRAAALARRDAVPLPQRIAAATIVTAHDLPIELPKGAAVSGYAPIRSEVDPLPLMKKIAARGLSLALPVIAGLDRPLIFRAWTADTKLVRGPLGIMQPDDEAEEVEPDIVIVPLAAFDRQGHRIGYGAGQYDRTLEHLRRSKHIIAIGVALAVQEIAAVPAAAHDVRLDLVLTEREIIDCRGL